MSLLLREIDGEGKPGAGGAQTPAGMADAMNKGQAPAKTPDFKVPEQYSKEDWAKNIKSSDDLFNQFANTQKLLGKKGVMVPGEKATPDEISAYHKALGVPDTEDGYDFPVPDGYEIDDTVKTQEKTVKAIMKKHGISKKAAEAFVADYRTMEIAGNKEAREKAKALDVEFDKYVNEVFGSEKDVKLTQFKEVLKSTLDPKFMPLLSKMDNASAIILAGLTEKMYSKYGQAGTFLNPKNSGTPTTRNQNDIIADLTKLHSENFQIRPQTPQYNAYVATEAKLKAELDVILTKK